MLSIDRQYLPIVILLALGLTMFILNYVFGFHMIVHELGHAIIGTLYGGYCTIELKPDLYNNTAGVTDCRFPEGTSASTIKTWAFSGIGTEMIVSLILIAIPWVSVTGGIMLFWTGTSMYFNAYEWDFQTAGVAVPDEFKLFYLVFTIIVWQVSCLITGWFWYREFEK